LNARVRGRHILSSLADKMSTSTNSVLIADTNPGDETSLLDILDHVLNAGVVIRGNLVISLAGVDLVYVGLDVILTSIETALKHLQGESPAPKPK
jgi:hypothetical protein